MCSRSVSDPIPIPKNSIRGGESLNVENIDVVKDRLKNALIFAKSELSECSDIQSSIVISDVCTSSIVINELKKNDDVYIVIYKCESGISKTLFRERKNKWRFVFLENITNCKIFVKCKLLKIMFERCTDCNVSLSQPLIGSCEFLRCENISVNIRIQLPITQDEDFQLIPYIRIELCNNFKFVQYTHSQIFIIKSSFGILGTIVNGYQKYDEKELGGKLFWNEQEQSIVSFSKSGFVSVPQEYVLNDISNHIITKKLSPIFDECLEDIGLTPPISSSF